MQKGKTQSLNIAGSMYGENLGASNGMSEELNGQESTGSKLIDFGGPMER